MRRRGFPSTGSPTRLDETITVLKLVGEGYAEHGVFGRGDHASGVLLRGFEVDVSDVFNAR